MSLKQFFLILKARSGILVMVLLATILGTLAISLFVIPTKYTAETTVLVDVRTPDPVAGLAMPANAMPSYMPTQIDIINSDRVAMNVVSKLRLDQNPSVRQKWQEATDGRGRIEVWIAQALQKELVAKPGRESNVITISFSSPDPGFSAAVANAFAQAYVDTNVGMKIQPARLYADWFRDQGKGLRENLEKAQSKLSAYQQAKGIVVTDEKLDSETAKLSELSSQLTLAQVQTNDAQSKVRSGAASESLPEVTQNALIQSIKGDILRMEAKLGELNIGQNHPQYQRMQEEITGLRKKLADETRHITSGFTTASNVGRDKEATLRSAIASQKQKLLQLKSERDEAAVLLRDIDAAQRAYDAVSQRFTQTSLESQSNQTNIAVLTPASEPIRPSSPKPVLYSIVAAIVGLMLGMLAAFTWEMLDRRVRSSEDLELALDIPVLAKIGRDKAAGGGRRLLALGRNRALKGPGPALAT
jgi:succinoglycan biosynthesis transport protein ExoP